MSVKTCVVQGWFIIGETKGKIFESAEFGKGCKYSSAHEFILEVANMHKRHSNEWSITNVVIG